MAMRKARKQITVGDMSLKGGVGSEQLLDDVKKKQ